MSWLPGLVFDTRTPSTFTTRLTLCASACVSVIPLPHAPRNRHVPLLLCLSRAQATCLLLLLATKRRDARRESTILLPVGAWVWTEWRRAVRKGGHASSGEYLLLLLRWVRWGVGRLKRKERMCGGPAFAFG